MQDSSVILKFLYKKSSNSFRFEASPIPLNKTTFACVGSLVAQLYNKKEKGTKFKKKVTSTMTKSIFYFSKRKIRIL